MKKSLLTLFLGCVLCLSARASSILGSAVNFSVLGSSTVTNTGATTLYGGVALTPGTSLTGFGTATVPFFDVADSTALNTYIDAVNAFDILQIQPTMIDLSGQNLGNLTLAPGVYHFDSSAQLTGTLTLDAEGLTNQYWVFQVGSALTTASASAVSIINGGTNEGVFWQVGSSATLGTTSAFQGNIVALDSITLDTGASIGCGSALAITGAVTLDTNVIGGSGCTGTSFETNAQNILIPDTPASLVATPEPKYTYPIAGLLLFFVILKLSACRRSVAL